LGCLIDIGVIGHDVLPVGREPGAGKFVAAGPIARTGPKTYAVPADADGTGRCGRMDNTFRISHDAPHKKKCAPSMKNLSTLA
jgi:hypothetical protein